MFEQVKKVVLDSAIWSGKQTETHKFVLTPAIFKFARDQYVELLRLVEIICEALKGVDSMAMTAAQPGCDDRGWGIVRDALRTQVPKLDLDLLDVGSNVGAGIFKFDIIEGADGRFYVPEIDTRVVQNWGVGILTERMRFVVAPEAQAISNMAQGVVAEFRRQGGTNDDILYLIYPDVERFYKPYFMLLKAAVAELGIQVEILHENRGLQVATEGGFFVDLPFCKLNQKVAETLARRYRNGQVKFLVPPKGHLGSKNVLGLISNASGDDALEEILRAYIPAETLTLLRRYFPESRLVHSASSWNGVGQRYLLKGVISGGSKEVTLGDAGEFAAKAEQARREPFRFILQKEIETRVRQLPYFGPQGELMEDGFGVRLIVHVSSVGEIMDVSATACRNKRIIHGGKEALMFGAAII